MSAKDLGTCYVLVTLTRPQMSSKFTSTVPSTIFLLKKLKIFKPAWPWLVHEYYIQLGRREAALNNARREEFQEFTRAWGGHGAIVLNRANVAWYRRLAEWLHRILLDWKEMKWKYF